MEKPRCRLCQSRHLSSEPHAFEKVVEAEKPARAVVEKKVLKGPLSQVERNRRWREKNRERYNAYQREYMRRRQ